MVLPSIRDATLEEVLRAEPSQYNIVDLTRLHDWCRSHHDNDDAHPEVRLLAEWLRMLKVRDDSMDQADALNHASRLPVNRRRGEEYVPPTPPPATPPAQEEGEEEGTAAAASPSLPPPPPPPVESADDNADSGG